jgi:hypothetical protein
MPIKKPINNQHDELRPGYDLSKLTGGVRGKYYERAAAGTTLVLLDPDVAAAFPDGAAVNQALRVFLKAAKANVGAAGPPAVKSSHRRRRPASSKRRA